MFIIKKVFNLITTYQLVYPKFFYFIFFNKIIMVIYKLKFHILNYNMDFFILKNYFSNFCSYQNL